jgi:hypothetical protein
MTMFLCRNIWWRFDKRQLRLLFEIFLVEFNRKYLENLQFLELSFIY